MKIDKFDIKILNLMQKDCRLASDVIAQQIGLSVSAVQRRIKRLREEGVISGEIALIDQQHLGNRMAFIAGVEIERDNYQTLKQFNSWAREQDNIQQIHYVTGTVDLMLYLSAANVAQYDAFIEQMMTQFPTIGRVVTNVVLDSPKQSFFIPLEE